MLPLSYIHEIIRGSGRWKIHQTLGFDVTTMKNLP